MLSTTRRKISQKNGKKYDLILDFVSHHSIFDYKKALSPTGKYVVVGGSVPQLIQTVFLGKMLSKKGKKSFRMLLHKQNKKDLEVIVELIESGKIKPIIDSNYPLSRVSEAMFKLGEGHVQGKVVVTVDF